MKKDKIAISKKLKGTGSLMSRFDPYGSYTGKPIDPKDKPMQDADDL